MTAAHSAFRIACFASCAFLAACSGNERDDVERGEAVPGIPILDSPWPRSHRTEGQQAVTPFAGPSRGEVQVRRFVDDTGQALGTSPFMVLSGTKYPRRPRARTLWGASLTHVFKYEIDGDTFRFADEVRINVLPLWVGWNLFRLPGDRIVVPNPNGLQVPAALGTPCYGTEPSLLVFEDGETPGSSIRCTKKFEFSPPVLRAACGFERTVLGTTAVLTGELPSGEVAVTVVQEGGSAGAERDVTWLAVLDPMLDTVVACAPVGEGTATNQFPVESSSDGASLVWIATNAEIVAMRFDPRAGTLERRGTVPVAFRARTGTTPTLMDTSDGRRLLLLVDGRCAVVELLTGAIRCSDEQSPSRLVVVDRDDLTAAPRFVDLPAVLDTIENSPAVAGDDVVVANYSGYTPDGERDGLPDVARGIAMLRWTGTTFERAWVRADIQISGVPTISTASGTVYGSGAEDDGATWFYGLDRETGETRLRAVAGPSTDTAPGRGDAVFDAGNNTLIDDDGSAIFPGGETLVRVR